MALPFRSIFGLADESGSSFDPSLTAVEQGRGDWLVGGQAGGRAGDGMFTVESESLSEAIPFELRSGAATHSSKVTLRLEDAELEPGGGEVITRLLHVYRACPQLFTVAIDDSLDMPVKLRLVRGAEVASALPPPLPVHAISTHSAAIEMPAASEVANPFRTATSVEVSAQAPLSPFLSPLVRPIELPAGPPPLPVGAVKSPFAVAPVAPAVGSEAGGSPISPFLAALTGGAVAPVAPPELSPIMQAQLPREESSPTPELRLSFSFHTLLGRIESGVLGVNPAALPLDWKTHLPWSFLKPQFASGRVAVQMSMLIEHADAPAKIGLQGVNGAIEVIIPLKEIVRQLPPSEILPGPAAVAVVEKSATNPFLAQAQEESARGFVPLKEAPAAMLDPTAPVLSPFRIAPDAKPVESKGVEVSAPMKPGKGLDSLDDLRGATPELVKQPLPEAGMALPVSRPVPVQAAPSALRGGAAAAPASGETNWLRFDGVGVQPVVRDLELRAVFGRSEPFTRQLAVDLTAALPGVLGCVLFSVSEKLEVLAKAYGMSPEVVALVERMPRMYQRIQGLAEDLGFESGETFNLRTSHGVVGFFLQGDVCLSVLQAGERNDAGGWERLVLIARGMASLRE